MHTQSRSTSMFAVLVSTIVYSGTAWSGLINQAMVRIPPDDTSGSGHTVRGECGNGEEGWEEARARVKIVQVQGSSYVQIGLRNARPDTVYTVWLRLAGTVTATGLSFGGSPLTGGGATPLVAGYNLPEVLHYSPPNPGTPDPSNGFTTDAQGNGKLVVALDFPVLGGAYPFNFVDLPPTAIVNPAAEGIDGPFMLRVVSHCQDDLAHGVSPANREAWFDWPN